MDQHTWPKRTTPLQSAWLFALGAMMVECKQFTHVLNIHIHIFMYVYTFIFLFIYNLATSLMVKNVLVTAGVEFVDIFWSTPTLLPMSYKVNIICQLLHNGIEYKRVKIAAAPQDTVLNVPSLLPGSHCMVTLQAIYNPASIDSGITHNVFTPNSSE